MLFMQTLSITVKPHIADARGMWKLHYVDAVKYPDNLTNFTNANYSVQALGHACQCKS